MAAVIAFLLLAALCILVGPLVLTRGKWRLRFPRIALTLWTCVFLTGLGALLGSLVWSLVRALAEPAGAASRRGAWFGPMVVVIVAWLALAVTGAVAGLVLTRAEPLSGSSRRAREQLDLLAAAAEYRSQFVRGVEVVFIQSDLPYAISFPGTEPRVLVTSELEEKLTSTQLRAVIEHERAHLSQHHGVITQLAQLNRMCVPSFAGAREFERATHLLVELIADDASARVCGAANAANALLRLGRLQGDESMALRASRLAARPPRKSVRYGSSAPDKGAWLKKSSI
jgi:Zn-dependent protease with chaperone function